MSVSLSIASKIEKEGKIRILEPRRTFCSSFAGLMKIILDATQSLGLHFNSSLVVVLLLPLLAYVVWRIVRAALQDPKSKD